MSKQHENQKSGSVDPKAAQNNKKLTISLLENGRHSLDIGVTSFYKYTRLKDSSRRSAKNRFLLRDSIMMLHHGIELLMKEILIRKSEYLIFEDLEDATKKQISANKQGVNIFSLEKSPLTVSYEEAIRRVEAFVRPAQLTESLHTRLGQLNTLRNQLEHYAIDVEEEYVVRLVSNIRKPLLDLIRAMLGESVVQEPMTVEIAWDRIQELAKFNNKAEEEVYDVLSNYGGKSVPGDLLYAENQITIPKLTSSGKNIQMYHLDGFGYVPDFLSEINGVTWAIEVKGAHVRAILSFDQMNQLRTKYQFQPWMIIFGKVSDREKDMARKNGFFITSKEEWERLKKLLVEKS